MYINKVAYLQQGEKFDVNSLIQIKINNDQNEYKWCGNHMYIKLRLLKQEKKLLEYRPDQFGKKITQLRIGNK